jgi:hypothetical protein
MKIKFTFLLNAQNKPIFILGVGPSGPFLTPVNNSTIDTHGADSAQAIFNKLKYLPFDDATAVLPPFGFHLSRTFTCNSGDSNSFLDFKY